jgi:hypothetical protein
MERGSSKHGPRLDEEMKHETEGLVRSGHPSHVQDWKEPEPLHPMEDEAAADALGTFGSPPVTESRAAQ